MTDFTDNDIQQAIDAVKSKRQAQTQANLQGSLSVAAKTDPDQFAKAKQLSQKTGLPVETVERDMAGALDLAKQGEFDYRYFRDHPLTANYLIDPDISRLASDDIENMGWWERQAKNVRQSWQLGKNQVESSYVGYKQMLGTATPEDLERADFIESQQAKDFGFSALGKIPGAVSQTLPMWMRSAQGGLEVAPYGGAAGAVGGSVIPGVGTALGFKAGVSAGFAAGSTKEMAIMEAGSAFREYQRPDENGVVMDQDTAKGAALTVGVINGLLEQVGFSVAINQAPGVVSAKKYLTKEGLNAALKIPTVRNTLLSMGRAVGKTMATEGLTEGMQETNTMLGRAVGRMLSDESFVASSPQEFWTRLSEEMTKAGGLARVGEAAEMGALAGVGFAMPNASIGATFDMVAVARAKQNKERFDTMAGKATESKLRQRDPEAFGQHVENTVKKSGAEDVVYVDGNALNTLYQTDPVARDALLKAIPDLQSQLAAAVESGSDVQIPIKQFSAYIAPSEFYQSLSEYIRLDPNELTMAEARQVEAEAPELLKQLQDSIVQEDKLQPIKESIFTGLSKKYDRASAERMTRVFLKAYQTIADRSGLGVDKIGDMVDVRVLAPLPAVLTKRGEINTTLDPMIDSLKSGKEFSDKEVFGENFLSALVKAGGLLPAGELDVMDAKKSRPGLINKNGMSADDALIWAYENGYLKEKPQQFEDTYNPNAPDANRVYDMVAQSLRGENIYTGDADTKRLDFNNNVEQLRKYLDNAGIDWQQASREEIKNAVTGEVSDIQGRELEQSQLPETIEIDGEQRPTTNNKGQPIGRNEEEVRNFYKWFADSKVVDENGRPLVVYHGTGQKINEFNKDFLGRTTDAVSARKAFFFSENPYDSGRYVAASLAMEKTNGERPSVIDLFLDNEKAKEFKKSTNAIAEPLRKAGQEALKILPNDLIVDSKSFGKHLKDGLEIANELNARLPIPLDIRVVKRNNNDVLYWGTVPIGNVRYKYEKTENGYVKSDTIQFVETYDSFRGNYKLIRDGLEGLLLAKDGYGDVMPIYLKAEKPKELDADRRKIRIADSSSQKRGTDSTVFRNIKDGIPSNHWLIYDPSKIKSAVGNRGTFDPNDPNILYQADDVRDLVATHNLTSENLLHSVRQGGMAVPSLAVTKKESPLTGFGEITLIGDSGLVNPKGSRDTKVFGADIYSPRYPAIEVKLDKESLAILNRRLAEYQDGRKIYGSEITSGRDLVDNDAFVAFAKAKGVEDWHGMKALAEKLLRDVGAKERIFKDYDNYGNRKYIDHTIDNVIKLLKKELRGGENYNYGVGSIRSKYAPEFKTIEQIRKAKDRLVTDDQFSKIKDEIDKEFFEIADKVKEFHPASDRFGFGDTLSLTMKDAATMGIPRALKENGFNDVPVEPQEIIAGFLNKLKNLPTAYFEAKLLRAVGIGEFKGAVVPDDVDPDAVAELKRSGITDIKTYKHGDEADRVAKIGEFENLFFQNAADQKPRGKIQFIRGPGKRQFDITLLDGANLSTFFHETAHFWLELMGDIVEQEGVNPAFSKDYEAVLKWLGAENRDQLTVEQHEQFARGFEAYLFEGKAPSPDLIPMFQRFKQWMLAIYKSLKSLNVEINDEVRGVFDRLLATDEEIEASRQEINAKPLTAEMLKKLGATDNEIAAYNDTADRDRMTAESEVFRKAYNYVKRQKTAEWNEAWQVTRREVKQDVNNEQVYRAIFAMRDGTMPDGSALPEGQKQVFMSKEALESRYGKYARDTEEKPGNRIMSRLKNLNLYRKDGGFDPEIVAPLFGYRSGDEMVQSIVTAQNYKEYVDAETNRRMDERFPDPLTDGSIPRLAMDAVHNEHAGEVILKELNLIYKKTGKQARSQRVFKALAEGQIGRMKISDIRPGIYKAAEARESRLAEMAMVKNDLDAASDHKRRQLLNHYLYSEAAKSLAEAEKLADFMSNQANDSARAKLGKAGGDYLERMDEILDIYDFRRRTLKELQVNKSLSDWYNQVLQETGFAPSVTERVMRDVTLGNKVNYRSLSVDELRGVVDTAKSIRQAGLNHGNLIIAGERIAMDAAKQNLADVIRGAFKERKWSPVDPTTIDGWQKLSRGGAKVVAHLLRLETLANWVDGDGNVNGWFHKLIWRPANEAAARQVDMQREYVQKIHDLIVQHHDNGGDLAQRFHIKSINEPMTKAGILAVMLNLGNEGNKQRVLDGRGWNESVLDEIRSHVTKADMDFVQSIWDALETLWPQIAELEKRMTGLEPPKVEATPLKFTFGDYRGGYYPISYDRGSPEYQKLAKEMDGSSLMQPALMLARTQTGHTKTRVDAAKIPIAFDLSVIPRHLDDVIHDLTHREFVVSTKKLLDSYRVQTALKETVGPEISKMLNDKLRQIASDRTFDEGGRWSDIAKLSRAIKRRVSMMAMGLSVISGVKQILGVTSSMEVLSADLGSAGKAAKYLKKGYAEVFTNRSEAINAVYEMSGGMRERMDSMDADIRSQMQDSLRAKVVPGTMGKAARVMSDVQRSAYFMIQYAQTYATDMPTFYAAYLYAADEGMSQSDAVAYAESVVRRSQGAGGIKDVALIEGQPMLEWFTMFYSFFSAKVNRQMSLLRKAGKAKEAGKLGAIAPLLIAQFAFMEIVPAILEDVVNQAAGRVPEDDEDEMLERWFRSVLIGLFSGVPIVRDIAARVISEKHQYRATPVEQVGKGVSALAVDAVKLAEGDEVEGRRIVLDLMDLAGYGLNLPMAEPRKRMDYLIQELGDDDPVAAHDFMWHMVTGAKKE